MRALAETLGNRAALGLADLAADGFVTWAAERWPDRIMHHLDAPSAFRGLEGHVLTARDLERFVTRLAGLFQAAGIRRYERVAICKRNAPDYVLISAAVMRAGGIAVPIHGAMSPDTLARYLEYTGATLMVTDAETWAARMVPGDRFPSIRLWLFPDLPDAAPPGAVDVNARWADGPDAGARAPLHGDTPVLIAHTSGTTGVPKGVLCSNAGLVASVRLLALMMPFTRRFRTSMALPYNHKIAHDALYADLLSGFPVWPFAERAGSELLTSLESTGVNAFMAFPDVFLGMYEQGLQARDLSAIKVWLSAGDASHEAHMKAFVEASGGRLGAVFIETLGTSEVGAPALARFFTRRSPIEGRRLVGATLPGGPRAKVADAEGRSLPAGQVGRLMVKGDTLFSGYWNAHDRLLGVRLDGWWWTGDVARRDRRGRFYHLDREADVLTTDRGVAYSLLIEEVLLHHPDVVEAVVLGRPGSPDAGEIIGLVGLRPYAVLAPEDLLAWANARLPTAERLDRLELVPLGAIDRGLTGKVLKRRLRERLAV